MILISNKFKGVDDMSELNKFKSKLQADKKLQKRMNEASTIKDVVDIASSVGCSVTDAEVKEDIMDGIVGGVGVFGAFWSCNRR